MALQKINDISAAGSVLNTMQLETDIGGSTPNKVTTIQVKDYVNGGKSLGKTVYGGKLAGERLTLKGSEASPGEILVDDAILIIAASGVIDVVAATGLTSITHPVMKIQSDGGEITLTSTPAIVAPSYDGQILVVWGSSDTNKVTLSKYASNGVKLNNGASFTFGLDDNMKFKAMGGVWVEMSRCSITV